MVELTRRYVILRLATDAPFDPADPDAPFVLKPWKDPAALRALRAYRECCYPALARDLDAWIRLIEAGPTVRGDVGRRNEPHARPHGGAEGARAKRPRVRPPRPARPRGTGASRPPRPKKRAPSPRAKRRK